MKSDRKRRSYKEYSLNDRLHGEQLNIGLRPLGKGTLIVREPPSTSPWVHSLKEVARPLLSAIRILRPDMLELRKKWKGKHNGNQDKALFATSRKEEDQ